MQLIIDELRLVSYITEYQKTINLLDNTPNRLSKFRTKNRIEINDQSRRVYTTNNGSRFRTTM